MRVGWLDALRGLAVVWMVIFHFSYDMMLLGMVKWDFSTGFWWSFPRVIAFTFLFCVGASLNLAHTPKVNWVAMRTRTLKLAAGALAVSLGTFFVFPSHGVFFGTLHCILVGSLFGALVVNQRLLALGLMLAIMIGQYALGYDIQWVSSVIQRPSMDFIPIYPWFWTVLAGIIFGPYLSRIPLLRDMNSPPPLTFLGRHSLKIYLLHQPLIYAALLGVQTLLIK